MHTAQDLYTFNIVHRTHIYITYTYGPSSYLHPRVAAQGRGGRMERKDWDRVKNDEGC